MPEDKLNRNERMKELMKLYRSEDPTEHDYAAQVIVSENMAYVVKVINRSFSSYKEKYFDELKQEGAVGLLEALINYDPEKGAFTTWADAPIRHRISDFVSRQIHNVHPHYARNISKIKSALDENAQDENPSDMDVVDIVMKANNDMKPEEVRRAIDIWKKSNFASIDEGGFDSLSDDTLATPEEAYESVEEAAILMEAINSLPDRERKVVMLRFGIGEYADYYGCSQAEAAEITGVPAHLYRAVLSSATGKLRRNRKLQAIRGERVSQLGDKERNTPISLTDIHAAERTVIDLKEESEYEASPDELSLESGNGDHLNPKLAERKVRVNLNSEDDEFPM